MDPTTSEIAERFLSQLQVSRTTPTGRVRRNDTIVLSFLREFGLHLTGAGELDGVHYENDPLLLFLVRPPDVALCVRTSAKTASTVAVSIDRTDIHRSYSEFGVDVNALPGSLVPACKLLAALAAELRSVTPTRP